MIIKAEKKDIEKIEAIINQAKDFLNSCGVDQWQGPYPNASDIAKDIETGCCYIIRESGKIIATASLSFEREPAYDALVNGSWRYEDYLVIHRLAVDNTIRGKGYASLLLLHAEKLARSRGIYSLRVDTHEDNRAMLRLLSKNGFDYRGDVYYGTTKRVGYEKVLVKS